MNIRPRVVLFGVLVCLTASGWRSPARAQRVGEVVNVEVTVPPKARSIKTTLTATPSRPVVNQGQVITYTFSYQSTNSSPVPLTLQAYWGLGTTSGIGEDEISGLEYQVGSATPGFGGALPVVDLAERTITWTLAEVPATDLPQEVQFKLLTSDVYQGVGLVTFPVEARVTSIQGVPVVSRSVGYVYQPLSPSLPENADVSLESSEARGESNTLSGLRFSKVAVTAVNDISAKIEVDVSQEAAHVQLVYGNSPDSLMTTALVMADQPSSVFYLTNLQPQAVTYFKVVAETSEQAISSDAFSFSTAAGPTQTVLEPWLLTVAQKNRILRQGKIEPITEKSPVLTLEQKGDIDVSVSLPNAVDLQTVEVILRGPESVTANLAEVAPGAFTAKLHLPTKLGEYELISRISDTVGNVSETKLQKINLAKTLRIVDAKTGEPLKKAQVRLLHKDLVSGGYVLVENSGMVATNPLFSDSQGLVSMARVPGQYKVDVLVTGYQPAHLEFELDSEGKQSFPDVELETAGQYWLGRLRYRLYSFW